MLDACVDNALLLLAQIIQVTDPAIIAEALRSKELDKRVMSPALNYFAGPHSLPTLLTGVSDERWKAVRYRPWLQTPTHESCTAPSSLYHP